MAEITPPELKFRFQLNKQLLANINISNPSGDRLAFKVKTTAPKKYVVRPSSGIVEANGNVNIQVIMQAQKEYPDFINCKDKFMVQTTPLAESEIALTDKTFSKDVRGESLKEHRLKVAMEGPAAPPSPVPERDETEEAAPPTIIPPAPAPTPPSAMPSTPATAAGSASDAQTAALRQQVAVLQKESTDLKQQLFHLQTSASTSPAQQQSADAKLTIVHLILVAVFAFLLGHFIR